MRLSIFNENDKVLLLGEGNFSFTTALCKHNLNISIISTCYEATPLNQDAIENINYLKNHGISVLFGIDATKLSNYSELKSKTFHKIIFNFPHVCCKMRLDLNRNLLKDFFISCNSFLKLNGQVIVTLCNGQGGTLYDNPRRRWDDSWKIKEMAAHGNFILKSVESFLHNFFENYESTGFRGLDKKFHTNDSLTHFFIKVDSPIATHFIPKSIVHFNSLNLQKSADSLKWNEIFENKRKDSNTLSPPIFTFDMTFTVPQNFDEINFLIFFYNNFERITLNVEFIRLYKFPNLDKIARTYRITYQSDEVPLYRDRVIEIHEKIIPNILRESLNVHTSR